MCVHPSDLHETVHGSTKETRSEKLAALVVRFTTLFSGLRTLSSFVSARHVFAGARAPPENTIRQVESTNDNCNVEAIDISEKYLGEDTPKVPSKN